MEFLTGVRGATLAAALMAFAGSAIAADWQAGAPAEWKQWIELAKKEGPVVIAGSPEFAQPLTAAYERDTGLKMDFLAGGYNELEARFVQGARAGNPTIDVYFAGGTAVLNALEGIVAPVKEWLILPETIKGENWKGGYIKYEDDTKTFLPIPNEYVHGWPLFDSNVIKPGTVTKWTDLADPKYKGKIAAYDPTVPGPGQAVGMFLGHSFGLDYIKKVYVDNDAQLSRNPRQLVEWVARGNYAVALATVTTHIEAFKKEGITNIYVPQMTDAAGILLGGSSLLEVAKNPPHPYAVRIFANWYLSQPGQTVFADVWKTPSRRTDVKVDGIPEYVVPKDGLKYNEQYTQDWYLNQRPKIVEGIVKAVGR